MSKKNKEQGKGEVDDAEDCFLRGMPCPSD